MSANDRSETPTCEITPERHLEIIILTEDCDGSVPCPKCHAESALEEVRALRTSTEDERAVLTELLRLYDWRFELAKEQEELGQLRGDGWQWDDPAKRKRQRSIDKRLRQYGREKKAAWDRAREVLARREKGEDK